MFHSHSHGHDHSHTHHSSHGHSVPWSAATAQWYEPGWDSAMLRHVITAAELSPADVLVDIDSGDGAGVCAAAAWITRGQLIGITSTAQCPDVKAAAAAHPDAARLDFRAGASEKLPVDDATASIAWSIDALTRWSAPGATIEELRRVLRPGGRLFIAADAVTCHIGDSAPGDPAPIEALLKEKGFRGINLLRYRDGNVRTFLFTARRAWS